MKASGTVTTATPNAGQRPIWRGGDHALGPILPFGQIPVWRATAAPDEGPANLIKFRILPDKLRTQANSGTLILRQMAVQIGIHPAKKENHRQRQADDIERDNRVGHKGLKVLSAKQLA